MFLLRVIVFLILVSIILILGFPLFLIYDLSNGGNFFGVCGDISTCVIPITEGPKLLAFLIASFFLLVLLLRLIMVFINKYQKADTIL